LAPGKKHKDADKHQHRALRGKPKSDWPTGYHPIQITGKKDDSERGGKPQAE
jgi:hypothetical protein